MIEEKTVAKCTKCHSTNLSRNGLTKGGKQKYVCKDCHSYGSVAPARSPYSDEQKEKILNSYQERASMRGIQRIFGTAPRTLARWLEKKAQGLPSLENQLLPRATSDVLELDEVWSFVGSKENRVWLWTALCRETKQIVGYFLGDDRSEEGARALREAIAPDYRSCPTYSDGLESYQAAFTGHPHHSGGKEEGQTNHMERWNNTLRQRIGRYVRKTLSFSKLPDRHAVVVKVWIATYNLAILAAA
jgi:insertion element IS1 protein InsB